MSKQTLSFQAEVAQLLHLVTHSLYSNKEIFLRELISNASDACDKLRYEALGNAALWEDQPNLEVRVAFDKDGKTLTITDNGIGLSQQEAIDNLGTIAKSGTRDFVSKLEASQKADAKEQGALIGQFGVGFYSGFIVADKITVESRRAGLKADEGVRWISGGTGEFEVESITRDKRGTSVILHLRDDALEYASAWRLKSIIGKYSDHISLPILMQKEEWDAEKKENVVRDEWETVNKASALWSRPKKDITAEQYTDFYKQISYDSEAPLAWSHNKVEGSTEYTQLLYIPAKAPQDLWNRDKKAGLKLYVKRVFIMDDAEQFLPLYLRFVRGVVDSNDLPLNVSRELLQNDAEVEAMRSALTRRVLDMLARLAKDEPEKYATFWKEFGSVVKEGVGEDAGNRDRILPLLRFASTHEDGNEPKVALADYVARMKEGQAKIYYVIADSVEAARGSPYIEKLRERGIEVLLMADRVDEWVMGQVREFEGKSFKDVARGDLELGALAGAADEAAKDEAVKESKGLLKRVKDALGDRVAEVRVSTRLTDTPACVVLAEHDLGAQMRRILEASGQAPPPGKPTLELNVAHPLVQRLDATAAGTDFDELALLLYDQARLAESGSVANPGEFVRRLNRLLGQLMR